MMILYIYIIIITTTIILLLLQGHRKGAVIYPNTYKKFAEN